jgi:trk system potassium uptake protein TrkH
MKFQTILRVLGSLSLGFSAFMLPPMALAIYLGENDWKAFLASFLVTLFCSLMMIRADKTASTEISSREGFMIVSLVWVTIAGFGCLPYVLANPGLSFTDSIFETISGLTTTGASIMPNIEAHSKSILLWRSITHWLGGMGIIVLGLAILPILGIGGMELFKAEVSGPGDEDKLTPKVKDTARILWQVYVAMTVVLLLLLLLGGMNFYDSVNHAMSTVSSGGFSTKNQSIAFYQDAYIHWVLSLFMILAGVNYYLHWYALTGRLRLVFKDSETRVYLALILICSLILVIILMAHGNYTSLQDCIREVVFVVSATFTSTGFGLTDYTKWPMGAQMVIFAILFCGGCAGSTAGGIKVIRHVILAKFAYQQLYLLVHPRAISRVKIADQVISSQILFGVLSFVVLWFGFFGLGCIALSLTGLDLLTSSSAVATCLSNIGPGLGLVGPVDNFGHITTFAKWILSFLMLLGRLEILTLVVLFTPVFWRD